MAFGMGFLRLSSKDFWHMTPREIASAMRAYGFASMPEMRRAKLDALMAAFPDEQSKSKG